MAEFAPLPDVIRRADGRLVPFEPETICHDLFAATQIQGAPDWFLARELSDGVLHFLAHAHSVAVPSDDEIAQLVVKVVRELGQPGLARVYECRWLEREQGQPKGTTGAYPSDLLSLHEDGLLRLTDQENPSRIAARVVGPHGSLHSEGLPLLEAVRKAAGTVGQYLALDGSESVLAEDRGDVFRYLQQFHFAVQETKLKGIINLNSAEPPAWAAGSALGPLFEHVGTQAGPRVRQEIAQSLVHVLGTHFLDANIRIWWHLSERDFGTEHLPATDKVLQLALTGTPIEFVFDRPRKPVKLGPGLDRQSTAVLTVVGVDLLQLARQLGETAHSTTLFLKKLSGLVRFATTAGYVRQTYLRQHGEPTLNEAFLLDRARLAVIPRNLDPAVRAVLGAEAAHSNAVADLAAQTLAQMRQALKTDQHRRIFWQLDSLDDVTEAMSLLDPHLLPQQQVRYGARLHQKAEGGRIDLCLAPDTRMDLQSLRELLHLALRTEVARLRIRFFAYEKTN